MRQPVGYRLKGGQAAHRLTLGELEALASLGTARLFALYHARVAGHEAFGTQCRLVLGIDFDEGAGDGEAESFGLSFVAATIEVDLDVILLNDVERVERLLYDILKYRRGEIYLKGTLVDSDSAITFTDEHACDCGFTTAYCINFFHTSYLSLLMSITLGF